MELISKFSVGFCHISDLNVIPSSNFYPNKEKALVLLAQALKVKRDCIYKNVIELAFNVLYLFTIFESSIFARKNIY